MDIPTWTELQAFIVEQMKTNQWFQTVGFFGVLGIIWQYTKAFPNYLWTRIKRKITFTTNIETDKDTIQFYVADWCGHSKKLIPYIDEYKKQKKMIEDVFTPILPTINGDGDKIFLL